MSRPHLSPPPDHRASVLARVRSALRKPTDEHVKPHTLGVPTAAHPDDASFNPPSSEGPTTDTRWLPDGGRDHAQRVELFAAFSEKLKTRFEVVNSADDAHGLLRQIAAEENWQNVGVSDEPLAEAAANALDQPKLDTNAPEGYDPAALERCDVGITGCVALIAQTGSVLVDCISNGGRALSALPPHHVVIATAQQMVPDLVAGYAALREAHGDRLPTQITFITGPSRTGDIERILVLGAHGPKKLTVILIDPDAPSPADPHDPAADRVPDDALDMHPDHDPRED